MATKLEQKKESPLRDPQCGRQVDPGKAHRLTWEGKAYFFCSEGCKRQFEADPPGDAGF